MTRLVRVVVSMEPRASWLGRTRNGRRNPSQKPGVVPVRHRLHRRLTPYFCLSAVSVGLRWQNACASPGGRDPAPRDVVTRPAILAERLYQARQPGVYQGGPVPTDRGLQPEHRPLREGEQAPSSDVLLRLAQNLGVSASWLVGEEGQPDQLDQPAPPPRPASSPWWPASWPCAPRPGRPAPPAAVKAQTA